MQNLQRRQLEKQKFYIHKRTLVPRNNNIELNIQDFYIKMSQTIQKSLKYMYFSAHNSPRFKKRKSNRINSTLNQLNNPNVYKNEIIIRNFQVSPAYLSGLSYKHTQTYIFGDSQIFQNHLDDDTRADTSRFTEEHKSWQNTAQQFNYPASGKPNLVAGMQSLSIRLDTSIIYCR